MTVEELRDDLAGYSDQANVYIYDSIEGEAKGVKRVFINASDLPKDKKEVTAIYLI